MENESPDKENKGHLLIRLKQKKRDFAKNSKQNHQTVMLNGLF